jgi:hypothetical protein
MRAIHFLPGAFLALTLLGAGASSAFAADEPSDTCTVSIDRGGAADSLSVVKQVADGGACVCAVSTGPSPESESIEKKIAYVQTSGKCGKYDYWPIYLLSAGAGTAGLVAAFQDSGNQGNDSKGG